MSVLFWFSMMVYMLCSALLIAVNKERFSSSIYILVGVCLPLILYAQKWSGIITNETCTDFYLIFVYLFVIGTIFHVLPHGKIYYECEVGLSKSVIAVYVINVVWITAILLENYYLSGYLFPALHNIDVHARQAPLLLYITRASYAVLSIDILIFCYRKLKGPLIVGGAVDSSSDYKFFFQNAGDRNFNTRSIIVFISDEYGAFRI